VNRFVALLIVAVLVVAVVLPAVGVGEYVWRTDWWQDLFRVDTDPTDAAPHISTPEIVENVETTPVPQVTEDPRIAELEAENAALEATAFARDGFDGPPDAPVGGGTGEVPQGTPSNLPANVGADQWTWSSNRDMCITANGTSLEVGRTIDGVVDASNDLTCARDNETGWAYLYWVPKGQGGGGEAQGVPTQEIAAQPTAVNNPDLLSFGEVTSGELNEASVTGQDITTSGTPVPAGGENFAGRIEVQGAGGGGETFAQGVTEFTIPQATNLQECAEGFVASMAPVSGNVQVQYPYCYVFTISGEGELNLNLHPGERSAYNEMMGGKTASVFILGSGTVFVNGNQFTLSALPIEIPFGMEDVAAMTFRFANPGGFAMVEFKDSDLEPKTPDIREVEGTNRVRLAEAGFAPAGENNYCAWAVQWELVSSTGNIQFFPTDCWQLAISGTGSVILTFYPDSEGYSTAAQGGVLGLWPMGTATMTVTRGGVNSEPFVPNNGSPGIAFPENGGPVTVTITFDLGEFIVMPLGPERNNIEAQF
jgi:hypothetical protein